MSHIHPDTLTFLRDLAANNNRDWFESQRDRYELAHQNMIEFANALRNELRQDDELETRSGKDSLMRIYRDVRFSKDKSPYKTYWGGGFRRATTKRRGGYYFHIEPGASFAGGGFWGPNPEDLKKIRDGIAHRYEELREIINHPTFKSFFGELRGDQVKTAPRGYDKMHPAIDLLRYKQFLLKYDFPDEEVTSPGFASKVSHTFTRMHPFFDFMSEILSADADGHPVHG